MQLPKDWKEFIELLNSLKVEYVVVGGFALAFHGVPRYTGDIDILVRRSADNASKLERVLAEFGFKAMGLTARDFQSENQVIQLGVAPNRIDLLTSITGVGFDEVWEEKVSADLDGVPVYMISRDSFIRNKRATARAQDLADLESLGDL